MTTESGVMVKDLICVVVILLMVGIEVTIVLLLNVIMDTHYMMMELVVETNPLILIGHGMDAIGIVRHHQHFI